MNRKMRFSVAAIIFSLVPVLWLASGFRIGLLFVDWADVKHVPFETKEILEVATKRTYLIKSDAVSLLCADDGAHLMFKGRLDIPSAIRRKLQPSSSFDDRAEVTLDFVPVKQGLQLQGFETRSAVVDYGEVDTIVTEPLSKQARSVLLSWLRRGAPQTISVGIKVSSLLYMRATVTESAVTAFLGSCPAVR